MAEWKTRTYTLKHPVTIGEGEATQTIREIVMREPDVEALERIQEAGGLDPEKDTMPIKTVVVIVSALSGIPESSIRKMHVSDFTGVAEDFGPLLESLAGAESPPSPSTAS